MLAKRPQNLARTEWTEDEEGQEMDELLLYKSVPKSVHD
jgi:hypothetical protein